MAYADPIQKAYLLSERFAGVHFPPEEVIFRTGIVAVATFGGITLEGFDSVGPDAEVDPWFDETPGNKGWRIRDVIVFPEPIPCKGAQGLWNVPDDVLRQIEETTQ